MGRTASWYRNGPRRVEAVQLINSAGIPQVAAFLGARSWHVTDVDVEFYGTPSGTMVLSWEDWVVRIHDVDFEVVPAPLFAMVYEPSLL